MKQIYLLILGVISITSCSTSHTPRNIEKVTIKEFKIDSTSIRAIHVFDANKMYYAGSRGDIGHTTDGGNSWDTEFIRHQDSVVPHFRSIAFNGKDIFALSVANPALLYKVSEKSTSLVYKEENESVFYDSMKFFENGTDGIAVGDPTEDCASILLTSDAGNSWFKISCDNLPMFEKGEAFFAASNTNIKIIGNTVWIASGGKKSRILKSEDKGKTWKIFSTPIIQGNGPQGMYSLDFSDVNNGIAIGGDYSKPTENKANKAITNDGGETWQLVANETGPTYKSCVQYVPNTNGQEVFTVGKTGVSFSNDSGKTWKEVSKDAYYTIQFVDKNTAWLSGNNKIGKLILE
jgi:photosystem II stability/assembly factor-like uncharacterized protein